MSFVSTVCIKSGNVRKRIIFCSRLRDPVKMERARSWLLGASALLSSRRSTREKVRRHRLRITVVVGSRRSPSCSLPCEARWTNTSSSGRDLCGKRRRLFPTPTTFAASRRQFCTSYLANVKIRASLCPRV